MRIAVVGATGRIGSFTVAALRAAGHDVVEISRSTGVDISTGDGLDDALTGAQAVVDASNTTRTNETEVIEFFTTSTRNLLAAEHATGVAHHVVLSIVNVDAVPGNAHYAGKTAQEREVESGPTPWSIVRATQFHDFAEMVTTWTLEDGTATIAPLLIQPIAPKDVGDILAEVATGDPVGRIDIAGPETQDLVDMARRTYAARGKQIRLVATWDGIFRERMAGKVLLPGPDARIAPTTFDEWLATG